MLVNCQGNAAEFGDAALLPGEISFIRRAQPWRMPTASMNSATISTASTTIEIAQRRTR
ncbi:unnamed protein product [Acidocella sp. C78]|nr:unnamed protein product [Acidocella sp. C78]